MDQTGSAMEAVVWAACPSRRGSQAPTAPGARHGTGRGKQVMLFTVQLCNLRLALEEGRTGLSSLCELDPSENATRPESPIFFDTYLGSSLVASCYLQYSTCVPASFCGEGPVLGTQAVGASTADSRCR